MQNIIVQIYEIQTPGEAAAVIAAGVDHVGCVVVSQQEWQSPELLETIACAKGLGAKTSLIPLFNDLEPVLAVLGYYQPDIVHFCEHIATPSATPAELESRCRGLASLQSQIRRHFPHLGVMRTIPIPPAPAPPDCPFLKIAQWFAPSSDYFLTDTVLHDAFGLNAQPVDGFVGITGQTCDWGAARRLVMESPIPVILAGGLSPENVSAAIRAVRPAGVDSCTLTNARAADGRPIRFKKDLERVRRFAAEAKRA